MVTAKAIFIAGDYNVGKCSLAEAVARELQCRYVRLGHDDADEEPELSDFSLAARNDRIAVLKAELGGLLFAETMVVSGILYDTLYQAIRERIVPYIVWVESLPSNRGNLNSTVRRFNVAIRAMSVMVLQEAYEVCEGVSAEHVLSMIPRSFL